MVSMSTDIRMLVLAAGFWVTLLWTEKYIDRPQLNPWDRSALLAGNYISMVGALMSSLLWCVVSASLLMTPK